MLNLYSISNCSFGFLNFLWVFSFLWIILHNFFLFSKNQLFAWFMLSIFFLVHHIIHSSEIFSLVIVVFSPRISFWFLVNVFYLLTFPFCSYILFLVLSILPLALWAFYRQLFWSLCLVIPPYGLSQGHFLLINFFL